MAWTPETERDLFRSIGRLGSIGRLDYKPEPKTHDGHITHISLTKMPRMCATRDKDLAEAMALTDTFADHASGRAENPEALVTAMHAMNKLCEKYRLDRPFARPLSHEDALDQVRPYLATAGNESERKARQYAYASETDAQFHQQVIEAAVQRRQTQVERDIEKELRDTAVMNSVNPGWAESAVAYARQDADNDHIRLLPKATYEYRAMMMRAPEDIDTKYDHDPRRPDREPDPPTEFNTTCEELKRLGAQTVTLLNVLERHPFMTSESIIEPMMDMLNTTTVPLHQAMDAFSEGAREQIDLISETTAVVVHDNMRRLQNLMPESMQEAAEQRYPSSNDPVSTYIDQIAADTASALKARTEQTFIPYETKVEDYIVSARIEGIQYRMTSHLDFSQTTDHLDLGDESDASYYEQELARRITAKTPLEVSWMPRRNGADDQQWKDMLHSMADADDKTIAEAGIKSAGPTRDIELTELFEATKAITDYVKTRDDPNADQSNLLNLCESAIRASYRLDDLYREHGLMTAVDHWGQDNGLLPTPNEILDQWGGRMVSQYTPDEEDYPFTSRRMDMYAAITSVADGPNPAIERSVLDGQKILNQQLQALGIPDMPAPDIDKCHDFAKRLNELELEEITRKNAPAPEPAKAVKTQTPKTQTPEKSTETIRGAQPTAPTKAHEEDALSM